MALKLYTIVSKGRKLKVRKFWGLIPTFVEVTGENMVGKTAKSPPPLNSEQDCNMIFKRNVT